MGCALARRSWGLSRRHNSGGGCGLRRRARIVDDLLLLPRRHHQIVALSPAIDVRPARAASLGWLGGADAWAEQSDARVEHADARAFNPEGPAPRASSKASYFDNPDGAGSNGSYVLCMQACPQRLPSDRVFLHSGSISSACRISISLLFAKHHLTRCGAAPEPCGIGIQFRTDRTGAMVVQDLIKGGGACHARFVVSNATMAEQP